MVDEAAARALGTAALAEKVGDAVLGPSSSLDQGWYFPVIAKQSVAVAGVIVNADTGRALPVMAGSSLERDPSLYDRGFQFEAYDLVVLAVANLDETVRAMLGLREHVLDVYYRNDRVYRVGRMLTEAEVRERLSRLPAVFSGRPMYHLEQLDAALRAGWFEYRLFESRPKS